MITNQRKTLKKANTLTADVLLNIVKKRIMRPYNYRYSNDLK